MIQRTSTHGVGSTSLAYSTLARLRESAEKRVWQQRRGPVVSYCRRSIMCRRSREAPAANQRTLIPGEDVFDNGGATARSLDTGYCSTIGVRPQLTFLFIVSHECRAY